MPLINNDKVGRRIVRIGQVLAVVALALGLAGVVLLVLALANR